MLTFSNGMLRFSLTALSFPYKDVERFIDAISGPVSLKVNNIKFLIVFSKYRQLFWTN